MVHSVDVVAGHDQPLLHLGIIVMKLLRQQAALFTGNVPAHHRVQRKGSLMEIPVRIQNQL
ncbi:hypothetical protein D3C73_1675630 [compost metagenome]